ncbi:MAG: tryptophan--tRNA ligase [Bacilli bacterium]
MKKTALTGIKPTGKLTLGNYIGVLRNLKQFQEENDCYIFIADIHALTLPIDPIELRNNSKDIAAFYLASGLDTSKCHIFLQSMVSEHSELDTIMVNYLYMGELSRMTQFKEISKNLNNNAIGLGVFTYPVLMASDILLYNADIVPVGEDQVQHVEITRELVHRFNNRYGDVLKEPNAVVGTTGKRIMSLSDPTHKMSKSDPKGDIFLKDDEKTIRKKIMSATTDSGDTIVYDKDNKPGISNLLMIYACLKDISIATAEETFKDLHQYGPFKKAVADAVVEELIPFQNRYRTILASSLVDDALNKGAAEAKAIAQVTLQKVKKAVGLYETTK